jgi:hypothetical protein
MAKSYPMVPAAAWWRLREQFQKSIPGTVSRSYVATVLGMEEKSAANLLPGLRTLGLINDEDKPTERANHWRFDSDYAEVCRAMREDAYPRELIDAVPEPSTNREAAIKWFMRNAGVGDAGAKKMATTYELVSNSDPARRPEPKEPNQAKTRAQVKPKPIPAPVLPLDIAAKTSVDGTKEVAKAGSSNSSAPSLHIDVQIHISADASADQIDQIFSSMARHLYKRD